MLLFFSIFLYIPVLGVFNDDLIQLRLYKVWLVKLRAGASSTSGYKSINGDTDNEPNIASLSMVDDFF